MKNDNSHDPAVLDDRSSERNELFLTSRVRIVSTFRIEVEPSLAILLRDRVRVRLCRIVTVVAVLLVAFVFLADQTHLPERIVHLRIGRFVVGGNVVAQRAVKEDGIWLETTNRDTSVQGLTHIIQDTLGQGAGSPCGMILIR